MTKDEIMPIKNRRLRPLQVMDSSSIVAPCKGLFSSAINPWEVYEEEKQRLPKNLSPQNYNEAIRKISDDLGI